MKIELNTRGLRKALPFLEKLSEDIYDGGVNMRIGRDGQMRMDAKNPTALMEIASGYGMEILYSGKDSHNDYCYDIIAEVAVAPAPPPSTMDAGAGANSPSDVSAPDPAKDAADAAKVAQEREDKFLEKLNVGLAAAWPKQAAKIGEIMQKLMTDMNAKSVFQQEMGGQPPIV